VATVALGELLEAERRGDARVAAARAEALERTRAAQAHAVELERAAGMEGESARAAAAARIHEQTNNEIERIARESRNAVACLATVPDQNIRSIAQAIVQQLLEDGRPA
jgi:hypothetical protein